MKTIYTESKQSERQFRRLSKLGAELRMPVPECFLQMDVTMPDGEIVHSHKQRSHSWNRNAYTVLITQLGAIGTPDATYGAGLMNIKNVYGSISQAAGYQISTAQGDVRTNSIGYHAANGRVLTGINVGTDTATDETFDDSNLVSPVIEGTVNDGQHLSHVESNAYVLSYDIPTKTYTATHIRFINNNSGGDVTIGEVALIAAGYCLGVGGIEFCTSRDHLLTPVVIPNGGQLKVTYTISLVYPA